VSQTTLYPASDYMSLGATAGCAEAHRRPIDPRTGLPVHPWAVECAAHEAFFMGYNRPKVLKYLIDPTTGKAGSQQRVLDSHPGFSTNPDTIPLTYDEQLTDKRFRETAQAQIDMMNALGTAVGNGLQIPREMMHFLKKGLPSETLRSLEATAPCLNGHDNPARNKHCSECGISMAARGSIGPGLEDPPGEPEIDLERLHVQSLRKRCRDAGLADKGSKEALIGRLQAAA
jgi:hypothetical protein